MWCIKILQHRSAFRPTAIMASSSRQLISGQSIKHDYAYMWYLEPRKPTIYSYRERRAWNGERNVFFRREGIAFVRERAGEAKSRISPNLATHASRQCYNRRFHRFRGLPASNLIIIRSRNFQGGRHDPVHVTARYSSVLECHECSNTMRKKISRRCENWYQTFRAHAIK